MFIYLDRGILFANGKQLDAGIMLSGPMQNIYVFVSKKWL